MVEYDAVIVGAGILGLSTAYHIKRENPAAKVLVVDRLNAAGQANTAKSGSAFRCLFSSFTNYLLADSSVKFYDHLQEDLDVDLKLKWIGYLWLLAEKDFREIMPVLKELEAGGLEYGEYDGDRLASMLCMKTEVSTDEEAQLMELEDVYRGVYFPKAGVIDADHLVRYYEKEFLRLDGKIEYCVEVKNLIVEPQRPLGVPGEPYFWQDARIAGVETDRGVIKTKKTVLAAGVWIPRLLDVVGIECHIKPKKRQIFCVEAKTSPLQKLLLTEGFNSDGCIPFTILPKLRVYIRPFPDEGVFWLGYADGFPRAFKLEEEPQPEEMFYQYGIFQVLVKYFPQFRDCRSSSAFAGLYEVNTLDGQPVIFDENDVIVVGGASGSGIMKADAIGRIAAALCSGEAYASLYDGSRFRVSDLGLRNRFVAPERLII